MKLLLIPDKFKGSLTSEEVSKAFVAGVEKTGVECTSHFIKASDGGDGFMAAVAQYKACISVQVMSENPLGKPIRSYYLYNQESNSAYIEFANASGVELLPMEQRNPMLTSTFGTGLQIKDAIEKGILNIYIGLGGSATNDGGIGMAQALGYSFLDADGKALAPIGESLGHITHIDTTSVIPNLDHVSFFAVNDVTNPLYGENGAAYVYAEQKGATKEIIAALDAGLQNLDTIVSKHFNVNNAVLPGSGAAGGAAYGLKSFLGATYVNGIDFILELSGVKKVLETQAFDFLVTGEGKIDGQTLNGKLIQGVLSLGNKYAIPVLAICGQLDISKEELKKRGVHEVFEIQDTTKSLAFNMQHAAALLTEKTANFFKKLKA